MPIITLQRRLREAGRIRIGQQVATAGGKKRPAKLETFRLTSTDQTAIAAAAELYGGDPHPWKDGPPGTFEVFTQADLLPVVVPPAATAFSQWFETWSGGGCTRRCDGERMVSVDGKNSDEPCMCGIPQEGTCKPTTRLNLILRDLPGLGVWRLESHGWYAATELAGTVEVCMAAATRGQLLPAVLRLEQREVRRVGEAKKNFAVPILDVQLRPEALGLVVGTPGIVAGEIESRGSWQPIEQPAPAELGTGSVGDAIRETRAEPPKRRKNSAPELPPTRLAPRGMPAAAPAEEPPPPPIEDAVEMISAKQMTKLMACMGDADIKDRGDRLAITQAIIGRSDLATSKELTKDEASKVIDTLEKINAGDIDVNLLDGQWVIIEPAGAAPEGEPFP